eukprot:1497049-Prymnesium_polylepis.1
MCDKCKLAVARTTSEVVAFAVGEGLYVTDAEGQHYAFKYGRIEPHFSKSVRLQAQGAAFVRAKGKAPAITAAKRRRTA